MTPTTPTPPGPTVAPSPKPPRKKGPRRGLELRGSNEARRLAYLVLEVLSGLRSPASASAAAGIAPQRYYFLELRAIQAMVESLEPRPRGPQPRPGAVSEKLLKRCERLEHELRRAQALLRSAQRAIGVTPPKDAEVTRKDRSGKERRHKRRPTIRARRTADMIKSSIKEGPTPSPVEEKSGA